MIRSPYLIQRAEIRRPFVKGRFTEAVDLDYMGSAEFEFGALPQSLRALQAKIDQINLTTEPRILEGDRSLRVLHTFDRDEYEVYFGYLLELRAGRGHTKETTGFAASSVPSQYYITDFWWDVRNNVMFSFDKQFMNRLSDRLQDSWRYMDQQAAARSAT
jgi:hypothetical protein